MRVKPTSRDAYYDHVVSGKATTQRERILAAMNMPLNRRQISSLTGIPINAVCGRVNALLENGDLRVSCVKEDPITGKRVEFLEPVMKQGELL